MRQWRLIVLLGRCVLLSRRKHLCDSRSCASREFKGNSSMCVLWLGYVGV